MAEIKNVAVFGAAGALGAPLLKELIASQKFNITVVARKESNSTYPESVKVVSADYESLESVTAALRNQDAVVSTVGNSGFLAQKLFVDAAIAAGVKRFIPSEFGSDLTNPKVGALTVFGHKQAVRQYLEQKVAEGAAITYTYVVNAGFLDWGLQYSFLLNWKEGKPEVYDGGNTVFTSTSLATVGKTVVAVLTHPEETKNRQVQVEDVQITQNKLIDLARKANPEKVESWNFVPTAIKDVEKSVDEAVAKGDFSGLLFLNQLRLSIFGGAEYGQPYKVENKALGIEGAIKDEDIVEIWKKVLA